MSTTVSDAAGHIRQMIELERKTDADALRDIAREARLSFWTLNNILIGRAKTVNADVRDRIRAAFIENCRKHASRLLHEAEMAERVCTSNVDLGIVANEIRALASRLDAAKNDTKGAAR